MTAAGERDKRHVIGIDVGGTFTDVLCHDPASGSLLSAKVPSLPDRQWEGVLEAIGALGIAPGELGAFVHGTTIATNALLERKGAPTGLVTTEGFRDTLEIGRTRRLVGGLFDIGFQREKPVVKRRHRLEVAGRIAADGEVLTPLDEDALGAIADRFRQDEIQAVAVGFMNAYVDDRHEMRAAARLAELLPELPICTSAALVRERGEYERFSTAALNAYLTPTLRRYLDALRQALDTAGVDAPVSIMGSNGGAMTLSRAADFVVGTFLSGPVGGVVGALRIAETMDVDDCITFDMGGTSTDVALIHGRAPRIRHANQVGAFPLQVPQLDIHTIGAGGGSIVHLGPDGTLEVGPESAGAVPGPACYGRGGEAATVSDANLLLGRLPTNRALSGGLVMRRPPALAAFGRLSDDEEETSAIRLADGAVRLAVAKMAGAVREVSVHRGFDPRAFALVGFGGAGPMHILMVADELAIGRVLIPRLPGHLSALGQLLANLRRDFVRPWGGRLRDLAPGDLDAVAADMRTEGEARLAADGIPAEARAHEFSLDMRYAGQSFTLPVPWSPGGADWGPTRSAFDIRHETTFGFADTDNEAEIVNVRLVSIGETVKPEVALATEPSGALELERRPVWFDGGFADCPVLARSAMDGGLAFDGPAIVEETGGTTVVPPGWRVVVHPSGTLDCRRSRVGDAPISALRRGQGEEHDHRNV